VTAGHIFWSSAALGEVVKAGETALARVFHRVQH